jgi:hypothetical protein
MIREAVTFVAIWYLSLLHNYMMIRILPGGASGLPFFSIYFLDDKTQANEAKKDKHKYPTLFIEMEFILNSLKTCFEGKWV